MNRNFYIVFSASDYGESLFGESDNKKRYYAAVMKVSKADNLVSRLESIGGLLHANICETRAEAIRIKNEWNEAYINNGTYIYGGAK